MIKHWHSYAGTYRALINAVKIPNKCHNRTEPKTETSYSLASTNDGNVVPSIWVSILTSSIYWYEWWMFNILEKIICYGRAAQDSWCDFICCISKWIHHLQHPLLVHGGLQFQIMNCFKQGKCQTPVQYNSYWQIVMCHEWYVDLWVERKRKYTHTNVFYMNSGRNILLRIFLHFLTLWCGRPLTPAGVVSNCRSCYSGSFCGPIVLHSSHSAN